VINGVKKNIFMKYETQISSASKFTLELKRKARDDKQCPPTYRYRTCANFCQNLKVKIFVLL